MASTMCRFLMFCCEPKSRPGEPCKGHEQPGLCLPWEAYEGVTKLLRHKAHHGLDLLGKAALIPDVTLAANRFAHYHLLVCLSGTWGTLP